MYLNFLSLAWVIVVGFFFLRHAHSCWKTALEDNSSVLFCWNWDSLVNTGFILPSQVLVLPGYLKISPFTLLEQNFCSLLIKLCCCYLWWCKNWNEHNILPSYIFFYFEFCVISWSSCMCSFNRDINFNFNKTTVLSFIILLHWQSNNIVANLTAKPKFVKCYMMQ